MKGFIFLMLFSLMKFSFAGDLTEGGGGGRIKEPTITRGRMVLDKVNGTGVERPSIEIKGEKVLVEFLVKP